MLTTTSKIPPGHCPYCGHFQDLATAAEDGGRPRSGDISICFKCGELAVFYDDKRIRKPTHKELAEIHGSRNWPEVEKTMRCVKAFHARSAVNVV